jgi:hypothetical protein
MKLLDILREIGEASATPYEYTYNGVLRAAYFTTEDDIQYKVTFGTFDNDMEIAFGVVDGSDVMDYEIDTNKGNMYRVMSTVMKIIRQAVSEFKPKQIMFGAAKSDPRRMKMYKKYVANVLKDYSVVQDSSDILVLQRSGLGTKLKQYFKTGKK